MIGKTLSARVGIVILCTATLTLLSCSGSTRDSGRPAPAITTRPETKPTVIESIEPIDQGNESEVVAPTKSNASQPQGKATPVEIVDITEDVVEAEPTEIVVAGETPDASDTSTDNNAPPAGAPAIDFKKQLTFGPPAGGGASVCSFAADPVSVTFLGSVICIHGLPIGDEFNLAIYSENGEYVVSSRFFTAYGRVFDKNIPNKVVGTTAPTYDGSLNEAIGVDVDVLSLLIPDRGIIEVSSGGYLESVTYSLGERYGAIPRSVTSIGQLFGEVCPTVDYNEEVLIVGRGFHSYESLPVALYGPPYDSNGLYRKVYTLVLADTLEVDSEGRFIWDILTVPSDDTGTYRILPLTESLREDMNTFGLILTGWVDTDCYKLSPIQVQFPDVTKISATDSLWELAGFRNLTQPGRQRYDVTVDPNSTWRWSFAWCATDSPTLEAILEPLNINFTIDGQPVYEALFYESREATAAGWMCQYWHTFLSGWDSHRSVTLSVDYSLWNTIFDGQASYPNGEYHQEIFVNVR